MKSSNSLTETPSETEHRAIELYEASLKLGEQKDGLEKICEIVLSEQSEVSARLLTLLRTQSKDLYDRYFDYVMIESLKAGVALNEERQAKYLEEKKNRQS